MVGSVCVCLGGKPHGPNLKDCFFVCVWGGGRLSFFWRFVGGLGWFGCVCVVVFLWVVVVVSSVGGVVCVFSIFYNLWGVRSNLFGNFCI